MIDTPMGVDAVAHASGRPREQIAAERAALVPMRRQGAAQDVANAAVFLASDDAAFITGIVLPVDGGSTLTMAAPGALKAPVPVEESDGHGSVRTS